MRRMLGCCLVVMSFWSTVAQAEPSFWQRVQRPQIRRAEAFLRTFGRWLDAIPQAEGDPETMRDFRLAAIATAELAGAHASEDPRVLLVLGHALLDADIGREEQVRAIAERILAQLAPGEAWLEAEARTLDALAARGLPELAIRKVSQALPLIWAPSARSTLFRERAEAAIALGNVQEGVRDQRAALATAERATHKALARFGLGLALERLGDLPSALIELRLAHATAPRSASSDLSVLDEAGAFFFRRFDVHYVSALTAMALAQGASESEAARPQYERALVDWDRFERAAPSGDPWLGNARLHRGACLRAIQALSAKR